MKLTLKIIVLCAGLAGLTACNLSMGSTIGTPVVLPPTQPVVPVFPTPIRSTETAAPIPQTPTFPPIITATPQPATATVSIPTPVGATKQPAIKLLNIKMSDLSTGWAVGQIPSSSDEHIFKTTDGGKNWKKITPPEPALANKNAVVHFLDAKNAWVIYAIPPGANNTLTQFTVWRTEDGGASWKSTVTSLAGLTGDYFAADQIAFYDASNGWLLALLGNGMSHTYFTIYKTSDGGASWKQIVSPDKDPALMPCSKNGVWFRDAEHGYLAGNCFGVVKGLYFYSTQDSGATWQPVNLPAPVGQANAFTNESFACGADTPRFFDAQKGLVVVSCSDTLSKTYRWVYQTKNGGTSWISAALPRSFGGYTFLNSDTGWYLGQTTAYTTTGVNVYTTSDGGKNWKQISGTNWGGDMNYVDAKNGWVIARSGADLALVRTSDGGLTYQLIVPQVP